MARLVITTGRPALSTPRTLAEAISMQIDALLSFERVAANEARGAAATDELLDGLAAIGANLTRLGRGLRR